MKYGICHLSVVPCRAEASDASEMVTQLLFGETIKVYEQKKSWYRIKTMPDNYECWIDEKQFTFIMQRQFDAIQASKPTVVCDLVHLINGAEAQGIQTVVMGSHLPDFKDNQLQINGHQWSFDGHALALDQQHEKAKLVEHAYMYLNSPYLWGGRSPFGIDCSGFVQVVYKLNGVFLPRDASQQATVGQALSFIEEAEEGDLAFFDNDEGAIIHVGIILSNNRIIHASGKVRIDRIDHQGIFNPELRRYSHRLRLIKKVI